MPFRVQKIRACISCGAMLSLKCPKCLANPERTARIVELYKIPPEIIVKIHSCGNCLELKCQREGCANTFTRYSKRSYKDRLFPYQYFYCGNPCATLANGAKRNKQIELPCAYCGKPKKVKQYYKTQGRKVFCNPSEYHLWRCKSRFEAVEGQKIIAREMEKEALLICANGCDGTDGDKITQHKEIKTGEYKCLGCGKTTHSKPLVDNGRPK